jgi:signal transduction histidine kinase
VLQSIVMAPKLFCFLTFIFFLFSAQKSTAQINLRLDNPVGFTDVGKYSRVLSDSTSLLTIQDILRLESEFRLSEKSQIFFGDAQNRSVWVNFKIENQFKAPAFIELLSPNIDTAVLYTLDENKQIVNVQRAGQALPFSQRALEANNIIFKLADSLRPVNYYLNLKLRWQTNVSLKAGSYKAIFEYHNLNSLTKGLLFGVIIAFVIYNLFVFIQLRHSVYLYYSLYLFSSGSFAFRTQGYYGQLVFRYAPQYNDYTMYFTALAGVFGMIFSMHFLETKKNLPIMHKLFLGMMGLYFLYGFGLATDMMLLTTYLSYTLFPMGSLLVLTASVWLWVAGNPTAKYYFFGWAALTVGIIVFTLREMGVLPDNFFTNNVAVFGSAVEAIILAIAVAHRFRVIRDEREKSQAEMLVVLKQNEELTQEKTRLLETIVSEKSNQLEDALSIVKSSEVELEEYARRLEKSNRELTDFAHIASHDMKAPIRGILSFAQLFERRNKDKFDETDREYFGFIKSNAQHSARLIDDVLNYSRIDKNLDPPTEVDMNYVLLQAEMNLKIVMEVTNTELFSENLPFVFAHSSLLVQLFQNLLANGAKYNKSEVPRLIVRSFEDPVEGRVFSVQDNGIGIAPENHKTVFGMFRRLHAQSEFEGTGIGLSFCERIVTNYGGRIWLESEVGKGTTIFFTLPLAMPQNQIKVTSVLVP